MLTTQEALRTAFLRGAAWRPGTAYENLKNLEFSDIPKLSGKESTSKLLLRSYQHSDANYDLLTQAFHARAPERDGELGPATQALLTVPRCPIPDFAPPPTASLEGYDDPDLRSSVMRYQEWKARQLSAEKATGRGSFPAGCAGDPLVHDVTISYDFSNAPSNVKAWAEDLKKASQLACAMMGIRIREVPVGQPANIRVSWKSLAGSTIGLAEFNNETCGDSVFCYLDPNYAPDFTMVLILLMHENGHNWNFEHSNGYIMNPSIIRVEPWWCKRDAAGNLTYTDVRYAKGKEYFGGQPIPNIVTPPDPTDPPTVQKVKVINMPGRTSGQSVVANTDFTAKKGDVLYSFIPVNAS